MKPGGVDRPLIALVGNPNSGKSTLFNALTGLRQKIGNYPGVTVEWKEGTAYTQHGKPLRVLDLPGSYSLNPRSPDEQILLAALLGRIEQMPVPDGVICCLDASNLERNLFLATQVLELGIPSIVVLNMMDVAERRGIRIDTEQLSERLGVPVVACEASRGKGIAELRILLAQRMGAASIDPVMPRLVEEAIEDLMPVVPQAMELAEGRRRGMVRLWLAADNTEQLPGPMQTRVQLWQARFDREIPGWRSELITQRYGWIGDLMRGAVRRYHPGKPSRSEQVDRVLLHPVSGFVLLGGVMALLFYSIFALAVPFMDAFDAFFGLLGSWAADLIPPGQVNDLVVEGVIGGVGGVLIFLPQILLLFFFISLLEATGYMARAAFILDRLMSKVGLHGRSFIPLLSSYACAVPGIMATRTIESPKDRLVTIMVAPFMTCSARLPVYLVLIAAIYPAGTSGASWQKALLLLMLYFTGTMAALGFAWLFRRTLLRGANPTMVMELPPYRMPQLRSVFQEMVDRGWIFIKRAGTIIFAFSIILWFLLNYPQARVDDDFAAAISEPVAVDLSTTFAGQLGQAIEPVFEPLGFDWSISLGIIASFAAREVFISTMAIVYRVDSEEVESLADGFRAAKRADGRPLFTPLTCLSILTFFVFALQCISTIAVVRRETHSWRWPVFQFFWMFGLAWLASFVIYQGGLLLGFH